MFDNTNPYTLHTEIVECITHYFISFTDGQAIRRETEVSRPVYLEFMRFIKTERNLRRSDERHIERSEVTDETLYDRAINVPKSVEDTAFNSLQNKQLRLAIQRLSEIQRRRFILYHEFGLTYEQIAKMEGCAFQVVAKSIKAAENKIKNFFESQG